MSESSAHPLGIEPPIPHLISGADEEELTINLGLGLVARKAAEAEYILHGIYVHLVEAEKAYSELAVATGGKLVQQCRQKLEAATLSASHSPKTWTLRRKGSAYGTATYTPTGCTTKSPTSGSP